MEMARYGGAPECMATHKQNKKHHTWTLLKRLAGIFSHPWCCFGDFNEILNLQEKSGGNEKNIDMVVKFREAVQACNLVDVGYRGYPFMWSNRRYGQHFIEERFDRFLCSNDWSENFHDMAATNLVNWVSDHCPILIEVRERSKDQSYGKKSIHREHYEDMWSSYEACKNIVRDEWASMGRGIRENPVKHFHQAVKNTLANLKI